MTPYVFFLDIDDTILYNNKISDRVRNAVKNARERGHFVYINTGRGPAYLDETIRSLPVDGYVCGCGSYIMGKGTVLYQTDYPIDALIRWMRRLSKDGDPGILVEGVTYMFRYRNSFWNPLNNWICSDSVEDFYDYLKTDHVVKANIADNITPALLPELEKDFYVIHHPTERYTECCPKGCSKASGMQRVMDLLGIPRNRSVAIGDSENDLDMIRNAGIGIAMGQAKPEIKKQAHRVTASVIEDGAAIAIEELTKESI